MKVPTVILENHFINFLLLNLFHWLENVFFFSVSSLKWLLKINMHCESIGHKIREPCFYHLLISQRISFSAERVKVKCAPIIFSLSAILEQSGNFHWNWGSMLLTYALCGLNLGLIWTHFLGLMIKLNALGGSWPGSLVISFPPFSA